MKIKKGKSVLKTGEVIYLVAESKQNRLPKHLKKEVETGIKSGQEFIHVYDDGRLGAVVITPKDKKSYLSKETMRNHGANAFNWFSGRKIDRVSIVNLSMNVEHGLDFVEGFQLAGYQFLELLSDKKGKSHSIQSVQVVDDKLNVSHLNAQIALSEAVQWSRDLVNRPLSHLTATDLAKNIESAGKEHGFRVEIFSKRKIQSLKMGGLLAVNKGSIDPPTFTIAEWKPKKPVNDQPVVLVGKGVVYDTGGMSLKPTPNSMDFMKSDMGGAAAMAGTIKAAAAMDLPVHIIALIPATDNRPDGNAYVPGDVITMYDGTTVEVKNTDAEGRLLLADALAYAKKLKPSLVFDAATLTGASVRAVGVYASSVMGTADKKVMDDLEAAGENTYERVVRFPLWDEYGKELQSDVADMSNLGRGEAGQISAGKFLQHFTDYPWVHIDIAGPAFLHSPMTYRTKGGSGVGVRLLIRFMQKHFEL